MIHDVKYKLSRCKVIKFINIYLFISLFCVLLSCTSDEKDYTKKLFDKYQSENDFLVSDISPKFLSLLIEVKTDNDILLKEALRKLDKITVLMYTTFKSEPEKISELYNSFLTYFTDYSYNILAQIFNPPEKAGVLFIQKTNDFSEMIVLLQNYDSFVAVSLTGSYESDMLNTLLKIENIQKIKELQGSDY